MSDKPVLSPDEPWEKVAVMCPHVIWDAETKLYRMWYSGGEQYEPNAIGYATSPDGLEWTKHTKNPVFTADPSIPWETRQGDRLPGRKARRPVPDVLHRLSRRGPRPDRPGPLQGRHQRLAAARRPTRSSARAEGKWDHDACYKPYAIFDGRKWLLWYNGRHGGLEQIGVVLHEGEDLGFERAGEK